MSKILHIEDDPASRLLVRKLLSPAGYEVVDAADGLEGVRKALAERPDLVLVDIAIPGLDGYEVTLRLRAEPKLRGVPIVAITAEGNRDTSLAVGCDGFLQKPIDARSFVDTVEGYLRGQRETVSPDATGQHLRLQSQRIVAHLEQKVAELSEANRRLRELDQARKEFYRNVSHELSTPMTPLVGYVRLLSDSELGPLSTPQQKALRAMDDCIQRLRGLIDNLLDVTGLETGRMRFAHRDYDFAEVARRAVARQGPLFDEARIRLVTDLPRRGSLRGYGDVERIARAIEQLLDNAAKFTPRGGTVGVRARRLPSGHYELCVADTGPGVAADTRERVFEPFYQVDGSPTRAHGGTGVGLAIVRGVARGHGGDVNVVSPAQEEILGERLNGAAFYFVIAERAPSVAALSAPAASIPPARGSIQPEAPPPSSQRAPATTATPMGHGALGSSPVASAGPIPGIAAGAVPQGAVLQDKSPSSRPPPPSERSAALASPAAPGSSPRAAPAPGSSPSAAPQPGSSPRAAPSPVRSVPPPRPGVMARPSAPPSMPPRAAPRAAPPPAPSSRGSVSPGIGASGMAPPGSMPPRSFTPPSMAPPSMPPPSMPPRSFTPPSMVPSKVAPAGTAKGAAPAEPSSPMSAQPERPDGRKPAPPLPRRGPTKS